MLKDTHSRKLVVAVCAAALGGALGGCSTVPDESLAGPPYPSGISQGRTLDVQVFREGPEIRFTNTTARPLGPGRLWLNGWYSREIPEIAVGESVKYQLKEFRDQYGAAFKGGGFFAARNPETLVLAQVQPAEGGELLGLVVVKGEAD